MTSIRKRQNPSSRVNWPKVMNDACRLIERDAPPIEDLAATHERGALGSCNGHSQTSARGESEGVRAGIGFAPLGKRCRRGPARLDVVFDRWLGTSSTAYAAASETLGATPPPARSARRRLWMGLSDLGWMLLEPRSRRLLADVLAMNPAQCSGVRAAFPRQDSITTNRVFIPGSSRYGILCYCLVKPSILPLAFRHRIPIARVARLAPNSIG